MKSKAVISATGVYHPNHVIDNDTLVESYNAYASKFNLEHAKDIQAGNITALEPSSAAFIEKASGIKQRYVMDKQGILDINRMRPYFAKRANHSLSLQAEFALKGIEKALKQVTRKSQDIDCVIMACSNFQRPYPALAIEVQHALGMRGFGFDMNVACSSATFGLHVANQMINEGNVKSVVVVNPEICSAHLDYTNRDSHFIFGDACTAVLVEHQDACTSKQAWKIRSTHVQTRFSNHIRNNQGFLNPCEHTDTPLDGELFTQEGRKVFKEVVPLAFEHMVTHCEKEQLNSQDIKRYWLHQANSHMNELIAKKLLGKQASPEQAPLILDKYANTAACGSIIAFDHHHHHMNVGDLGIICSFGAGYSVGSLLVEKTQ